MDRVEAGRTLVATEDRFQDAIAFATSAHGVQVRKYTGAPYIVHPIAVAQALLDLGFDDEVVIAAILHDTVEDGPKKIIDRIRDKFGPRVARLVEEVSDISRPEDGNRARRKAIDRAHLALASYKGMCIKLADIADNLSTIIEHDRDFARIYLPEKRDTLDVLVNGHPVLFERAFKLACSEIPGASSDMDAGI